MACLLFIPMMIGGAFVILFVAAIVLRLAVIIANKVIGPVRKTEPIGWDWDADEDKEDEFPMDAEPAIPKPSVWSGMRIVFLVLLIQILLRFVLDSAFRGPDQWGGILLLAVMTFAALTVFTAWLLPTTMKRAALVSLFAILLCIVVGMFFGGTGIVFGL